MARTEKLEKSRSAAAAGSTGNDGALLGEDLSQSGLLDRALLNQQIEAILEGASQNPLAAQQIETHLEAMTECVERGDIPAAANEVITLLSLELDDLRKAALLSLMVRTVGKRRFDPVAVYVLEKKTTS